MSLNVEAASSVDALRAEWEELDARTQPRLPFTGPLWTELWWQHFREDRALIRDTLRLLAVRDGTGALRGVAPLILTERPAVGPLRTRMLRYVGADPAITELCGPVSAPADADAVALALLDHFDARRSEWDLWLLNGLRKDGAACEALARRRGLAWAREIPDYYLPLPPDWDTFRAGLGRNIKESLRKCYNSLKRDGLSFELRVVTAEEDVGPALDRFFELHAARAALTGTICHQDVFADLRGRAFLRACCRAMARRRSLRLFQLRVAGQVVATRVAFAMGDSLYLYFSGYDPAFGKYSVMTTLVAEALRWAIEQRFAIVNLSPGNDVSKTRWGPREVIYQEALLPAPTHRGALVHRAYERLSAGSAEPSMLSRLVRRLRR